MNFRKYPQPVALQCRNIIEHFAPKHPVPYAIWAYLSNLCECERPCPTKEELMREFSLSNNKYCIHMKTLEDCNLISISKGRLTILSGTDFKVG